MTQARGISRLLTLCGAFALSPVSRGGEGVRTEITVGEGPEREVRFASGGTVYVEALVEGCWIGRSWNAQGRWERSAGHRPEPTFQSGARSDLATAAHWQESFQSDLTPAPQVHKMMAGFSVHLPPEALQSAYHGMWGSTMLCEASNARER